MECTKQWSNQSTRLTLWQPLPGCENMASFPSIHFQNFSSGAITISSSKTWWIIDFKIWSSEGLKNEPRHVQGYFCCLTIMEKLQFTDNCSSHLLVIIHLSYPRAFLKFAPGTEFECSIIWWQYPQKVKMKINATMLFLWCRSGITLWNLSWDDNDFYQCRTPQTIILQSRHNQAKVLVVLSDFNIILQK